MMEKTKTAGELAAGKGILGIELGSTRIKSVLIGSGHTPIAEGSYTWENRLVDGIWTYDLQDVQEGLQRSYAACMQDAEEKYGVRVTSLTAIGISGMMHGYLAFDENERLLVPFRTWRNTITKEASEKLTQLFNYNIPQRWSVAHLYQAILNGEEHVKDVRTLMTLSEYIHWKLTGRKVLGVGDASGMFPISLKTKTFDEQMLSRFDALPEVKAFPWKLKELLPQTLVAGEDAGTLTEEGAAFLDPSGNLRSGIRLCPPEGDADTGMIATNAVRVRTGNVSAGTSGFAILVLERELSRVYPQIDLITSPSGALAANIHCNNCTTDLNAWVNLFGEFAQMLGVQAETKDLYTMLYRKALEGEKDGGGLLSYNYFAGEHITECDEGRPLLVRKPDARFTIANLMRTTLYASLSTLKLGMDIITQQENMRFDRIMAHGGLFKTREVGQKILASVLDMPITVMETAENGGAWGIALLAGYLAEGRGLSLEDWLDEEVFGSEGGAAMDPDTEDVEGFSAYIKQYEAGLAIEKCATGVFR